MATEQVAMQSSQYLYMEPAVLRTVVYRGFIFDSKKYITYQGI